MHIKTMEGLIGASTNRNLMDTPMRVYREAERKGDTATMERAMGYAGECYNKAEEYRAESDEGMKKDAEEARRIAKEQREEAVQKRREEREKQEKKMEENRKDDTQETRACLLEISEEGKALLKDSMIRTWNGPEKNICIAETVMLPQEETGKVDMSEAAEK